MKRSVLTTIVALLLVSIMAFTACSSKPATEATDKNETQPTPEETVTPGSEDNSDEEKIITSAPKPNIPGRTKVDSSQIIYADNYSYEKLTFDGIHETEFSGSVEAETAEVRNGITVKQDDSCSGQKYVSISANPEFSLHITLPSTQYYKITVYTKADSHKENPLLVNGEKVMNIVSEAGEWQAVSSDGIFLTEGDNTITLGEGWSWFSIDYILFENSSSIPDTFYEGPANAVLSNPYANLKTQNIYQYLKSVYGKRTLAGQCTDYGKNTETDALYLGLGKYPAIRTFDFIFDSYSYSKGQPRKKDVKLAIEWSNNGGLVVFDWHWYAPVDGCAFYTEDTEFRISKARPAEGVDITYMDFADVQALYRAELCSLETVMLIHDIDNIASMLQELEDNNVTVMFRPLHEADGGWFWWGATGPEDYIWLWKLLYNRLTDYTGLDNLIWVWNAGSPEWYPGNDCVDIASYDIYNSAHDYTVSPSTLSDINTWTDGSKLITMSECATMPDPELIVRDNAYWLWFAVWNWDYIVVNGTTELSTAYTDLDMMKKVYESEAIITLDELPNFN